MTEALKAERDNWITNINRCHERIDELQTSLIGDLQGRISRIEGELKGIRNTMKQIQLWFINQAKGR